MRYSQVLFVLTSPFPSQLGPIRDEYAWVLSRTPVLEADKLVSEMPSKLTKKFILLVKLGRNGLHKE